MFFILRAIILLCTVAILYPARLATAQALGESELNQISQRLELTDSQKERLRPIVMEQEQEVQRVRNDPSLSPKEKGEKEISLRQTYGVQMRRGLSPSQMRKLSDFRKEEIDQVRSKMYSGGQQPTH
jgi:hypothetical protein